jgi:hypothetical protein
LLLSYARIFLTLDTFPTVTASLEQRISSSQLVDVAVLAAEPTSRRRPQLLRADERSRRYPGSTRRCAAGRRLRARRRQLVLDRARAAPRGLEGGGGIDGAHAAAVGRAGVALCAARTRLAAPGSSGSTATARRLSRQLKSWQKMSP